MIVEKYSYISRIVNDLVVLNVFVVFVCVRYSVNSFLLLENRIVDMMLLIVVLCYVMCVLGRNFINDVNVVVSIVMLMKNCMMFVMIMYGELFSSQVLMKVIVVLSMSDMISRNVMLSMSLNEISCMCISLSMFDQWFLVVGQIMLSVVLSDVNVVDVLIVSVVNEISVVMLLCLFVWCVFCMIVWMLVVVLLLIS